MAFVSCKHEAYLDAVLVTDGAFGDDRSDTDDGTGMPGPTQMWCGISPKAIGCSPTQPYL